MIEYIPMQRRHIDGLVEIEEQCFNSGFARKTFEKELENKIAAYFVAESDEMPVGYAGLWNICGIADVIDVAVHKDFRRQGIGEKLIEKLNIPVFHDDQHGTAIIVSAGVLNALKVVGKELENIKIVMSGAGAAGCAICKQLLRLGAKNITMFDINGIVRANRPQNDQYLEQLALKTNLENKNCTLSETLIGADVFIGVSKGGILNPEWVKNMAQNPVIFALANPTPEIMPDVALTSGAKIVATGRSDFPNQINNSLVFPGLFRGVIDSGLQKITDDIKILASISVASMVSEDELDEEYIIPDALNKDVAKNISACIIEYVRNPNTHTY